MTSMVTTGKKDMYNIFILYAMKGKDLGHDVIGESGRAVDWAERRPTVEPPLY